MKMFILILLNGGITVVKILVIGNGFDLAHGLHTKYIDFLNFLKLYKNTAFSNQRIASDEFPILEDDDEDVVKEKRKSIYERTLELNSASYPSIPKEYLQTLFNNAMQNTLIKYYMIKVKKMSENWIDFEKELEQIIVDYKLYFSSPKEHSLKYEYLQVWGKKNNKSTFWNKLKRELSKLCECLKIYLSYCLDYSAIKEYPSVIYEENFDKLLSFNYTDTYNIIASKKSYQNITEENIHHIHGTINNIVLGISAIDSDDFETIYFKKVFQRFQQHTGIQYANWLNESGEKSVTFFGHSLDVTDGDIVKRLILSSQETIIYYYNQSDYEQKVINLMKIFSVNDFEDLYYNDKRSIVFKPLT